MAYAGILAVFFIFAWLTWGHWGEFSRYDTGREMYVPYAILRGKMLYRDLWYTYGPLAPYSNALLFYLFGTQLRVLYLWGLTQTLLVALTLFAISRRLLPLGAAFLAAGCFLLQAFQIDLFNFVLPYAYATTLASVFSLLALYFCVRHSLGEPGRNLWGASACAALALLTKQEFGAASYLTVAFLISADAISGRSVRKLASGFLVCLPGLLVNAGVYGWFAWRLSPSFLFLENLNSPFSYHMRAVGAQWIRRYGLRLDLQDIVSSMVTAVLAMAGWFVVAFFFRQLSARRWALPALGASLFTACAALRLFGRQVSGPLYLYGLPLLMFPSGMTWLAVGALFLSLFQWRRNRFDRRRLSVAVVCFYALLIGVRIAFLVLPIYYGVYCSQALFVVFLVVLVRITAGACEDLKTLRSLSVRRCLLAAEAFGLFLTLLPDPGVHPALVRTKHGDIYGTPAESAVYRQLLSFMEQKKEAGQRVVVLPQEISLYFFTDTLAPTRWYGLQPGVLEPEGREREYVAQLEKEDIDYILLSNRKTGEYGLPDFGVDYCRTVYHWIEQNYEVVGEFGRFVGGTEDDYGVLIYQRRLRPK
jgi:hypothetical protein